MKNKINIIAAVIFTCLFTFCSNNLFADGPGGVPGDPSGNDGLNGAVGHPVHPAAPLGSGVVTMIICAGVYGAKKIYSSRKMKT